MMVAEFISWFIGNQAFSNFQYVVARRALALADEAIPCLQETASAHLPWRAVPGKTKGASQRHYSYLTQVATLGRRLTKIHEFPVKLG